MRSNRLLLSAALISMGALSACGTIMNGGDQTVDVVVKGSPTAFCEFTTQHFRNEGHFPNKLVLERSKDDLKADCKGEQNRHISFIVPTRLTTQGTVGNVPTGVVPGAAYDLGTGGAWAYPDPIIVDFRTVGDGPKPEWPGDVTVDKDRVGTAAIATPTPVRMRPVMDEDMNPGMMETSQGTGGTEVIDAVRLAVDGTPVAVTKTSTTVPAKKSTARMKPITSPEDDPAAMKAKQEAKAKAAAEAKRKAAEKSAAAKAAKEAKEAAAAAAKAEQEAKEAADAAAAAAAAQQQAAPATQPAVETPPSDAALTAPSSAVMPAPAETPAATTTTTTTTVAPATPPSDPATTPAPATTTTTTTTTTPERSSEMPPEPAQPAGQTKSEGTSTDMDKYLSGRP